MREIVKHLSWTFAVRLLETLESCDHWLARRRAKSLRAGLTIASMPIARS